jgi:hypothetical protein
VFISHWLLDILVSKGMPTAVIIPIIARTTINSIKVNALDPLYIIFYLSMVITTGVLLTTVLILLLTSISKIYLLVNPPISPPNGLG